MAITAGTLSQVSVSSNSASLLATAATGATGPVTYQWYQSTTTGFSPSGGNLVAGATTLSYTFTGLNPNVIYYYKVIATDVGHSNDVVTYTQLAVTTTPSQLSQNQFTLQAISGFLDQHYNYNTHAVQVDISQATSLYAGQPVKRLTSQTGAGVPKVVGCAADTDNVFGYINYDIKTVAFQALSMAEISLDGNVMYLYSTGVIQAGAEVTLDLLNGGVAQATGSSAKTIVGFAYDGAAGTGVLVRIYLKVPSYQLDS